MRALPQERPKTLSAPPDGQDLDQIIGELQSIWGVPQYPQEYRITVKIADERDGREPVIVEETEGPDEGRAPGETGAPVREKAPAAPLMRGRSQEGGPRREKAGRRRRRGRRRRGGGGAGGGSESS